MMETIEVQRYTCDGCGRVVMAQSADDFIGIEGNAFEATQVVGSGAEWFACQRKCVSKAVATALDKAWND